MMDENDLVNDFIELMTTILLLGVPIYFIIRFLFGVICD